MYTFWRVRADQERQREGERAKARALAAIEAAKATTRTRQGVSESEGGLAEEAGEAERADRLTRRGAKSQLACLCLRKICCHYRPLIRVLSLCLPERFLTLRRAPRSQLRGGLFKFSPRRLVLMNNAKKSLINWLQFACRTHTHTPAHTLTHTWHRQIGSLCFNSRRPCTMAMICAIFLPRPRPRAQPEPLPSPLSLPLPPPLPDSCVGCTLFSSIRSTNANASAESSLRGGSSS